MTGQSGAKGVGLKLSAAHELMDWTIRTTFPEERSTYIKAHSFDVSGGILVFSVFLDDGRTFPIRAFNSETWCHVESPVSESIAALNKEISQKPRRKVRRVAAALSNNLRRSKHSQQ